MGAVGQPRRGRPGIVPPDPLVVFSGLIQFGFQGGSWTTSGSNITGMDNLEGTAARDISSVFGSPGPQAVVEDGVDAILFQGGTSGGYLEWDGQGGALTEGEMFIVHKTAADPQAAATDIGLHHIYRTAGSVFTRYNENGTGNIHEALGFGSGGAQNTGNPIWDLTVQHLYNVRINSAGNLSCYYSGNNLHYSDTTARTVDFLNGTMKWGRTSPAAGVNLRWKGHAWEIWLLHTLANDALRNAYLDYIVYRYPSLAAVTYF